MKKNEWMALLQAKMAETVIDGRSGVITISDEQAEKLHSYMTLLQEWNEKMNLTAIVEDREVLSKHFLDCIAGLPFLPENGSWIDVGTGAGFPGMVLQIMRPEQNAVLMDALQKRLTFLEVIRSQLGLEQCELVHARAEEAGCSPNFREKYEAVVARAVAPMPILLEYCIPFLKTGGVFLAFKGPGLENELKECSHALKVLGAEVEKLITVEIPSAAEGTDEVLSHCIAVIRKVKPTHPIYPRKMAKIKKEPL